MEKGQIWVVELPEQVGKEQHGSRPAVVVGDTGVGLVLAVPLTSQAKAQNFPHTVLIKPSGRNGLKDASVALAFQLRAIDQRRLKQQIGTLSDKHVQALDTCAIFSYSDSINLRIR